MRPYPASTMTAPAACMTRKVPVRLTARIRSHSSRVVSSACLSMPMPAKCIRISSDSEPADGCFDHGIHIVRVGHVGPHEPGIGSVGAQTFGGPRARLLVDIGDHDVRSAPGERPPGGEADAAGATGHDGRVSLERKHSGSSTQRFRQITPRSAPNHDEGRRYRVVRNPSTP